MKPSLLIGRDTHREFFGLLQKKGELVVSGVSNETAKSLLISHFLSFQKKSSLLVAGDDAVEALQHWLSFFGASPDVVLPPQADDGEISPEALQRFYRFLEGEEKVFVVSRSVWEMPFPSAAAARKKAITLKTRQEYAFTQLIEDLLERGYAHTDDIHLSPGEYYRRGDTLELFPINFSSPVRILFSFDVIESMQSSDGKEPLDTLTLLPLSVGKEELLSEQLPASSLLILDDQDDIPSPKGATSLRFTAFPEKPDYHVHLRYLSVLKFYTLTDFLNDLKDKLHQGWMILIVSRRADELSAIFREESIAFLEGEREAGAVTLIRAEEGDLLPHSIQNPDLQCALLTDREIFSLRKGAKQRSIQKLALDFLTSLTAGDYVVHMEHGIGRFEGMTQKTVDGTVREYLELTYAEGDKLFIPVDQADKLSKYVHEEGQEPVLTRLGVQEWKRVSEKIRKETKEVAKELLALYAKRASAKGFSYGSDTDIQKAFEEAFPYEETPGQVKAIEDIKGDMEDPHPMDRLVCGDVGFGKTEVAMRAAFKAVQDGKQVTVVAPITILADQHYHSFIERMGVFPSRPGGRPIQIEMLSRFRTQKEQTRIIERLRKGDIDIIIGTHRLLQEDVKFLNLGLVIVDEEQRFGVKQKEKFKSMRASVDILTLTATPIPRTLNLGLHKLRDISTITTPPPGRLPIITEVRKYSDTLVREAIMQEIKRGGQCFMLHNRVETIDAFADKLRALIPSARFVVAHGQLKPDDLEERILAFKQGKFDVLVSSTIIENGIDLPRANTLIVNEAEHFGLSQLYQLRGRVGRSKVQAFAYLLYHTQKLQDDAKKRLRAIVEACELGSGFQVAMRDLEIRGAGEILGASQSGTMQTVGVSHYLRMLKQAVEELKSGGKEIMEEEESVEVLLPVEALLPSFYIPDDEEKISVYQKLAGSEEEETLQEFEEDLKDEYGEMPKQVKNLFAVLRLKLACRKAGVVRIKAEDAGRGQRDIVLTLSSRVTAEDIMRLIGKNPRWRISGSTLRIGEASLKQKGEEEWIGSLTGDIRHLIRERKSEGGRKAKEVVVA